jgi:hypothetical protein
VADAEFRYADLLPADADDTPYRLDLVAQGAQDPAVRLRVRLLVAGFGGIEEAEDALPEPRVTGSTGELGDVVGEHEVGPSPRGEPVEGAVGGEDAPAGSRAQVDADLRERGMDPEGAEVGVLLQAPHGIYGLQVHLADARRPPVGPVFEALDALLDPAPHTINLLWRRSVYRLCLRLGSLRSVHFDVFAPPDLVIGSTAEESW